MLYPIVPLFLTAVLHAPMSVVGLVEGVAEGTASLLKIASGWISDRIGRRKPLVVWGYGLSAASKPLLALARSWQAVLLLRFTDRTGKGLRTAPRDAVIAASCAEDTRGAAFGMHRALDTLGAVIGPAVALVYLRLLPGAYRPLFVLAAIPAAAGVLLLRPVREPAAGAHKGRSESVPATGRKGKSLPVEFRRFTMAYAVFAAGNSSDVFLLLKARHVGFSESGVLLLYLFYNVVYALAAGPAGWLSDRLPRVRFFASGLLWFALVYAGFAFFPQPAAVWILFALYGFYAAATEGVGRACVADFSPPQSRGTAMGIFHTINGLLVLAASIVAGILWDRIGPAAAFLYGSACALWSALWLLRLDTRGQQAPLRAGHRSSRPSG
ncbi:MAG TPA: MFS transporter [Kiritimatiellae bacterium]|nr:MFS transporter [Kiritimatiellia bacterium]